MELLAIVILSSFGWKADLVLPRKEWKPRPHVPSSGLRILGRDSWYQSLVRKALLFRKTKCLAMCERMFKEVSRLRATMVWDNCGVFRIPKGFEHGNEGTENRGDSS